MASIRAIEGGYELYCPFNQELMDELKLVIPSHNRSFDQRLRCWKIDTDFGAELLRLGYKHFGEIWSLPMPIASSKQVASFTVLYIGQCKASGKEFIARGMVSDRLDPNSGEWLLIFPEDVLREWFLDPRPKTSDNTPAVEAKTEYQVLALPTGASIEDVKRAYKRLVRSLHPDVNKEPNAQEQFLRVRQAYDILGNEAAKKKYDIALRFAAKQKQAPPKKSLAPSLMDYRSPLRCGQITVTYSQKAGGNRVEQILDWQDITRNGKVLVTTWNRHSFGSTNKIILNWV